MVFVCFIMYYKLPGHSIVFAFRFNIFSIFQRTRSIDYMYKHVLFVNNIMKTLYIEGLKFLKQYI